MKEYFALLGHKVRDRVTGAKGIVTSISFDLYGCVQAVINAGYDEKGKRLDAYWFDVKRLEVRSAAPVMTPPKFAKMKAGAEPGPAEKGDPHATPRLP